MFREIVFLVPWAPVYLFCRWIEREVVCELLVSSGAQIYLQRTLLPRLHLLSLWELMPFLHVLHFFNKREGFLFFCLFDTVAAHFWNLFPLWMTYVLLFSSLLLTTGHFNYVVTSEHLSWNISLGVGRWHEREGTQESKLVKEVGWNLPCYSCIAPNFLPPSVKEDERWVSFTYAGLFEQLTLLVQRASSRQRTTWIQTPGQEMWPEQVNKTACISASLLAKWGYWGIKWIIHVKHLAHHLTE